MQVLANSTKELKNVADKLLDYAKGCRFFIFEGEMGAGKTTFIKEICLLLGVADTISSPTFSIVNQYLGKEGAVYHFDFYRIKNLREAFDLGYEDYFYSDSYCLIEWPKKIEELLPENYVKVNIEVLDDQCRRFQFCFG